MLTAICDMDASTATSKQTLPQSKTASAAARGLTSVPLSDAEISRRVLAVRSGWSLAERVHRRRVADERFLDLMVALTADEAA
ncbi:MAG: hypothetical protein ACF788_00185 [Novipirellula sp. JB048]